MSRPRIGLALGSGSARGWAHIGVIDALVEAGIAPDVVTGASIGALVGAAYVADRMAELRQWALGATWRKIARLTDLRLTGGGLVSGRQVVAFLEGMGIHEPIESYATHYAAVATDMATGREIWLQSGPIHEAVRLDRHPRHLQPRPPRRQMAARWRPQQPDPRLGLPRARRRRHHRRQPQRRASGPP